MKKEKNEAPVPAAVPAADLAQENARLQAENNLLNARVLKMRPAVVQYLKATAAEYGVSIEVAEDKRSRRAAATTNSKPVDLQTLKALCEAAGGKPVSTRKEGFNTQEVSRIVDENPGVFNMEKGTWPKVSLA